MTSAHQRPRAAKKTRDADTAKIYLVGVGIASTAAAAILIREGDVVGHEITVPEASGMSPEGQHLSSA